ncbi:anti-sigma factor [Angustibacter luteus]|uniref:Anti-sigma factor n=1 Tax=Angustibacter luteus TaxID=658456 RepID=A0ABW1JIG2_9ACTN
MSHELSDQDLLALLRGELDRARTRDVVQHLRECETCRSELVEVAAVHGPLTAVARLLRTEPTPEVAAAPLPALDVRRHRRFPVWLAACAAAVVVLVCGAVGIDRWQGGDEAVPTSRTVALQPVTGEGTGEVSMSGTATDDDLTRMRITTAGLAPAGAGHFYYAWLLDPVTNKMLPLGVVSPDGSTRFDVSDDLVSRYHAVDISLQDDDGNPAHSATSVLRAGY